MKSSIRSLLTITFYLFISIFLMVLTYFMVSHIPKEIAAKEPAGGNYTETNYTNILNNSYVIYAPKQSQEVLNPLHVRPGVKEILNTLYYKDFVLLFLCSILTFAIFYLALGRRKKSKELNFQ